MFKIQNSTFDDMDEIFRLYQIARDYQKPRFNVVWPEFETSLIEGEIENKHQWKLIIDNKIACVWATTYNDTLIWEDKDKDPSVYLHRITTNPEFRGQNLVKKVVDWSIDYATKNNKRFVRLDTVGENKKLINHYQKCGFDYLGLFHLANTELLPDHYKIDDVALFEIKI